MGIKEKLAFVENIQKSHSILSFVLTLMAKINNPNSTVAEIEELINMNPGLASYILKLSNSPIFGISEEVDSVTRAITLLGMSNLRSLLTSYSIRLLCKVIRNLHAREYIWNHSLSTAVMSKIIAEKLYGIEQPNAYVYGLLHDIGKIVLYIKHPEKFQKSLEAGILRGMDFVSTEKQAFGFSHIETGYFMVDKMRFSEKMKNIVLFHHDPEFGPAGDKMHWIVSLSNAVVHYIDDNKPVDLRRYLDQINLSEKEFRKVIQSAQNHINLYKEFF